MIDLGLTDNQIVELRKRAEELLDKGKIVHLSLGERKYSSKEQSKNITFLAVYMESVKELFNFEENSNTFLSNRFNFLDRNIKIIYVPFKKFTDDLLKSKVYAVLMAEASRTKYLVYQADAFKNFILDSYPNILSKNIYFNFKEFIEKVIMDGGDLEKAIQNKQFKKAGANLAHVISLCELSTSLLRGKRLSTETNEKFICLKDLGETLFDGGKLKKEYQKILDKSLEEMDKAYRFSTLPTKTNDLVYLSAINKTYQELVNPGRSYGYRTVQVF